MIHFEEFDIVFMRPWILLLLVGGVLACVLLGGRKHYRLQFNLHLLYAKLRGSRTYKILFRAHYILLIVAFAFFVLSSAGTQIQLFKPTKSEGTDSMVFLLDISPSMSVRDIEGDSRWEAVREVMDSFLQRDIQSRIAVLLFSDTVSTLVPFTIDYAFISKALKELKLGILGDGTAISDAVIFAADMLSYLSVSNVQLILISDGAQNSGNNTMGMAERKLSEHGLNISVVHMGGDQKAEFSYTSPFDNGVIVGEVAPVEKNVLQPFAEALGASYTRVRQHRELRDFFLNIYYRVIESGDYELSTEKKDLTTLFFMLASILLVLLGLMKLLVLRTI